MTSAPLFTNTKTLIWNTKVFFLSFNFLTIDSRIGYLTLVIGVDWYYSLKFDDVQDIPSQEFKYCGWI